jgi:hypothetical protein
MATLLVHGDTVDIPIGSVVAGVEGSEVLPLRVRCRSAANLEKIRINFNFKNISNAGRNLQYCGTA